MKPPQLKRDHHRRHGQQPTTRRSRKIAPAAPYDAAATAARASSPATTRSGAPGSRPRRPARAAASRGGTRPTPICADAQQEPAALLDLVLHPPPITLLTCPYLLGAHEWVHRRTQHQRQRPVAPRARPRRRLPRVAEWSPWEDIDPDWSAPTPAQSRGRRALRVDGQPQGRARAAWRSPATRRAIDDRLDFLKPFKARPVRFTLDPGARGTKVTWRMVGPRRTEGVMACS